MSSNNKKLRLAPAIERDDAAEIQPGATGPVPDVPKPGTTDIYKYVPPAGDHNRRLHNMFENHSHKPAPPDAVVPSLYDREAALLDEAPKPVRRKARATRSR